VADDYDNDQTDLVPRAHIRQLEEQAKKARELEAQLAATQREAAFARALGNADHPMRAYFERGYDGELEVDAIRAAARDAGLFASEPPPATPEPQNTPTPGELAAHARLQAAAEGAAGNKPIDLIEAFGPRGSKKPDEIKQMLRACGPDAPFRLSEDMQ
jgi:hypothetical protein